MTLPGRRSWIIVRNVGRTGSIIALGNTPGLYAGSAVNLLILMLRRQRGFGNGSPVKGERAHLTERYPFGLVLSRWPTDAAAARALGVQPRTVRDWKTRGVPVDRADGVASAAGFHPFELWPELADRAAEMALRACDGPSCDEVFVLSDRRKRFCSPRCKQAARRARPQTRERINAQARARYAADPDPLKERRAMYRAECHAAVLAGHRVWRDQNREEINTRRRERYATARDTEHGKAA